MSHLALFVCYGSPMIAIGQTLAARFLAGLAATLPAPRDVAGAFVTIARDGYRGTTLRGNAAATLMRLALGFGVATALGLPLGLCMGLPRLVHAAINRIAQFRRAPQFPDQIGKPGFAGP